MSDQNTYDAIVVGAGVGGISVGSILSKEGKKVLILEQTDRVGGRALSLSGEEIAEKGIDWYKQLLKSQYTYLADSTPGIETIVKNRMLDGYNLDVGYHAISVNGVAYMLDFEEIIGGIDNVGKLGTRWGSHYKGQIYKDVAGFDIDEKLKEIGKTEKVPYLDFYTDPLVMPDEEIDRMEKVSFKAWADQKGVSKNDIIYNHLHTVCTLFSTINNPDDISMGDIFRYFKNAVGKKIAKGITKYNGGFVEGGVMKWSEAVVDKYKSFGGELKLNSKVKEIVVENNQVSKIIVEDQEKGIVEYQTNCVISNVPAQQTFKIINKKYFPEAWANKVESMYGYGSYTPYMGLNKLVMPESEAKLGLKNTCVLPKEEGFDYDVYICWNIQSVVDPTTAPEGKYLYTAYLPLTEKESLNKVQVKKIIDRLPNFMEEIYPGFKESIDWKLDLVCWKLEGVAKSISQAGTQKVPVKSDHVKGLYFAGDTAKGYGVAMDCAIASGVICAGEILNKDFGIR